MPGAVQKQQYNTSSSGLILQQCLVIGLSGGNGINLQSWEWFWTVTVKNVGNQRCLCKQKAHRRWHTKTSDSSWKQLLHLRISVSEVNQCHSWGRECKDFNMPVPLLCIDDGTSILQIQYRQQVGLYESFKWNIVKQLDWTLNFSLLYL